MSLSKHYNIPIFIIGIGAVDTSTLTSICDESGGAYSSAEDVGSLTDFYNTIYAEQKNLYLVEYQSPYTTFDNEQHTIKADYSDSKYAMRSESSLTPQRVISMSGDTSGLDGVDQALSDYLHGFVESINAHDFSYLEPTLVNKSPIYTMQKKFIMKDYSEELISFEIQAKKFNSSRNECVVTTEETYKMTTPDKPLHIHIQRCTYRIVKGANGWKMYSFVGHVKVLSQL